MKRTTKLMALVLAVLMMVTIFASCASKNGDATTVAATSAAATSAAGSAAASSEAASGTAPVVNTDEVTLTLMFGEHSTELYHEDTWVISNYAKEKYNVNLAITAIPSSDWQTKQSTVIASQEIPDLFMGIGRDIANQYGPKGMFLNLYNYLEQMPDMVACMEKLPVLKTWMYYSDNEIYSQATTIATEGAVNMCAYYIPFIRRDIMTELGVSDMPTTFEGLHDLLAQMKEAYPETYPWINRSSFDMILNVFAPGLGINVSPMACNGTKYGVWNEDTQTFTSIMEEDNFKWFLNWMKEQYDTGILDPNYAADDTSTWQDKLDNSQGFFSIDYFSRPDTMTGSGSQVTEGFELEAMLVPTLEGGQAKVYANVGIGGANAFSAKCANPERLAQLLNGWYYTEEGCLLMTYGIEGTTYNKNADGTLSKIYTDEIATSLDFDAAYGVNYLTFYAFKPDFFGYDLYDANQTKVYNTTWNLLKDNMIDLPPTIILNSEEQESYNEYATDLTDTLRNVFNEFVIGRRDISADWEAAMTELDNAGYSDFLALLNASYAK